MKNKKRIILIFCLFGFMRISIAQDIEIQPQKKEIIFKAYANFLRYNPNFSTRSYQYEFFQFTGITPAISFHSPGKKFIHEFEPKYWFSERENGNIKETEAGLRYELCWHVKLNFIPGLRFRWGFSSGLFYSKRDITTNPITGVRSTHNSGGFEVAATAHFDCSISKRVNLDLAVTNFNYGFAIERYSSFNAPFATEQTSAEAFVFDQFLLRLGLGYIL